jgi:hypothetical protein
MPRGSVARLRVDDLRADRFSAIAVALIESVLCVTNG